MPTRPKKILTGDAIIVIAITNFSNGVLEIEKMKLQVTEKLIDSKKGL